MSEHFSKHLSNIKTPKVEAPFHKRKLKNAVRAVYFNKGKVSQGSSLLDDLKNMSLKKLIPAGVLAIFAFTLIGQNIVSWRNTAYAQELIEATIQKIEAEPLTEEEKNVMATIEILEEMKKEGELKFLGEKSYPPEVENGTELTIQSFSFTDEDLSNDLIINVLNDKEITMGTGQEQYEDYEIKFDTEGKIINLQELKEKLKDANLKKAWIVDLIRLNNEKWLKDQYKYTEIKTSDEYFSGDWTEDEKKEDIENQKKCNPQIKNTLDQVAPLIKEAQVPLNGLSWGCGEKNMEMFRIGIFPISGQKAKLTENQTEIMKVIDKMSQFDTPTAKIKLRILEKALASKDLKSNPNSDNSLFSFPYVGAGADEELNITVDFSLNTEEFVTFTFRSESLSIIPGQKGEWIDVKIKNGEISNLEELKEKFKDPNLEDDLLLYIIQNQNIELGKSGLWDSKKSTSKIVNQLQEVLAHSEVPVMDVSMFSSKFYNDPMDNEHGQEDPSVLYAFGLYPLGKAKTDELSEGIRKLDAVIENLKNSITSENQSNIEILKNALKTNELTYEGEEKWDTKTVQKISFRDPEISRKINLYIDSSDGTVQFVVDSILSGDPYNRFQLDVDEKGNILNLEALKKRLNDPHLKKPWIKDLVRKTNLEWIKTMDEMSERNAWNETYRLQEKNIYIQLKELNKEAAVIIGGLGASYHGVIPSYTIDLYSITE